MTANVHSVMLFLLKKDEFLFLFYTSFHHDSYVFYFRHTEGNEWSIQCTLKKFEYTRNLVLNLESKLVHIIFFMNQEIL